MADGRKILLLSYTIKSRPNFDVPDLIYPRLKGVLEFHRFANLKLIAHFGKVVRALNQNGIIPMILKGGAMKYIRPELPRAMGDIDILVREEDYRKSLEIAKNLGYTVAEFNAYSADLHPKGTDEGTVDIHRFIDFDVPDYDKSLMRDFFSRATLQDVFGARAFVPTPEDFVFVALTNISRNLHYKTTLGGVLFALFDIKYLLETNPNFDWKRVFQNAQKASCEATLFFAAKLLNRISPNLLPDLFLHNKKLKKSAANYRNRLVFYRFYVYDVKWRCKKLKLKNAIKNFEVMKNWLKDKPYHRFLKTIGKSDQLIALFLKMAEGFNSMREQRKCS